MPVQNPQNNGVYIAIASGDLAAPVACPTARYTLSADPRLTEVTVTGTAGTRGAPVRTHPTATIEFPLDTDFRPEVLGLEEGAAVAGIWFRDSLVGGAGKGTKVLSCRVGTVTTTESTADDVGRVTVEIMYGTLTRNQSIPGVTS